MMSLRLAVLSLLASGAVMDVARGQSFLIGRVTRVTDGDTLEVALASGPITVRMGNIDAPEVRQPWGRNAAEALSELVLHQEVAIEVLAQDRYERLVAVVYVGDESINRRLVEQGHAWAYRQYLEDPAICVLEYEARVASQGLWSGDAVAPWEWRSNAGAFTDYRDDTVADCLAATGESTLARSTTPAREGSGQCDIKGNISDNGRIYHVPGSPSYAATRIDESRGERWFCSEEEARAAGWRAPRN
jgi:endonuclease YncB( thermonuclease family)